MYRGVLMRRVSTLFIVLHFILILFIQLGCIDDTKAIANNIFCKKSDLKQCE